MIRILLVDDHELVRTGFEHLLNESPEISVIGVASSGEEAILQAEKLNPDVVMMDIKMPGIGGIEASRKIFQKYPDMKIIALSAHDEGPFPQQLLKIGVRGFLSKSSTPDEMVAAIQRVMQGGRYLCPGVADKIALSSIMGESPSPFDSLSQRELQVVILTLQGKGIQEIAEMLLISPKTVNTYRYRVYDKLSAKNDVELTRLAIRYKLIEETTC